MVKGSGWSQCPAQCVLAFPLHQCLKEGTDRVRYRANSVHASYPRTTLVPQSFTNAPALQASEPGLRTLGGPAFCLSPDSTHGYWVPTVYQVYSGHGCKDKEVIVQIAFSNKMLVIPLPSLPRINSTYLYSDPYHLPRSICAMAFLWFWCDAL